MAMDQATRTHVSSKTYTQEVEYPALREAVMRYASLVGATNTSWAPTAMDIGSIDEARDETHEEVTLLTQEEGDWGEYDKSLN